MQHSRFNSSSVVPVTDASFLDGHRYDVRWSVFDRSGCLVFSCDVSTWSLRSLFRQLRSEHPHCLPGFSIGVFAPSPSGLGVVCIWSFQYM